VTGAEREFKKAIDDACLYTRLNPGAEATVVATVRTPDGGTRKVEFTVRDGKVQDGWQL